MNATINKISSLLVFNVVFSDESKNNLAEFSIKGLLVTPTLDECLGDLLTENDKFGSETQDLLHVRLIGIT